MTLIRDLQRKSETLFLDNKTLQQEVRRLQALHPVIGQLPARPSLVRRAVMRLVPQLRRHHQRDMLARSGLFDARWYLAHYPDVQKAGQDPILHFLTQGAGEWRDPGPHFSTAHYMRTYPDIAENGLNPLVHYLQSGWREGRAIRPGMRHGHPEDGA